jgi:hypothetical protein
MSAASTSIVTDPAWSWLFAPMAPHSTKRAKRPALGIVRRAFLSDAR